MPPNNAPKEIRKIHAGTWYWVSKSIIREYTAELGFIPVGVYHFLASMVNKSQKCFPSQNYIAKQLGCSRTSVQKALQILHKKHLIEIHRIPKNRREYQLLSVSSASQNIKMIKRRSCTVQEMVTNNTNTTNRKNDIVSVQSMDIHNKKINPATSNTKEELIAYDIVRELGEPNNFPLFLSYARKYPERILREALSAVKQTPNNKIRKSRGAFFIYLLKKHGN